MCFLSWSLEGAGYRNECPRKSYEVWAFRPSDDSQERMRYLLERNEKGESTEDETTEPERFGELEHLMQLVKARAIVCLEDSDSENR